jgi:uncharacterized protein (DUF849 family)
VLIQACLNGARSPAFHPALPLDPAALTRDALACVAAGAGALHLHPRDAAGRESLSADSVDAVLSMLRRALPHIPVGISTGEWIEDDPDRTLAAIAGWRLLPDCASVNLSESAAPQLFEALRRRGVGIEAGLADEMDAERFLSLGLAPQTQRILLEIDQQGLEKAEATASAILILTSRLGRPRLLHGFDATVWPLARKAAAAGLSLRIGLEDGKRLPDGSIARDNAELVMAARVLLPRRTGARAF